MLERGAISCMNKLKNTFIKMFSDKPLWSNCSKCGTLTSYEANEKGFYLQIKRKICDNCVKSIQENQDHVNAVQQLHIKDTVQKHYRKIAIKRGMPDVFKNVISTDFTERQIALTNLILNDLCKSFPWSNKSYIFHGDTGVGKSHLSAFIYSSWVYNNWNKDFQSSKTCQWISFQDLIRQLKYAINGEGDSEKIIREKVLIPNFLVLEFGDVEKEGVLYGGQQSNFTSNLFQTIVDYRWKHPNKRTIWVTRLGKNQELYAQLAKHYDEASIGRLLEQAQPIKISGTNRRKERFLTKSLWEL